MDFRITSPKHIYFPGDKVECGVEVSPIDSKPHVLDWMSLQFHGHVDVDARSVTIPTRQGSAFHGFESTIDLSTTKKASNTESHCIVATPPHMLCSTLELLSGSSTAIFHCVLQLPETLPPSHRSRLINYWYALSLSAKISGENEKRVLHLPLIIQTTVRMQFPSLLSIISIPNEKCDDNIFFKISSEYVGGQGNSVVKKSTANKCKPLFKRMMKNVLDHKDKGCNKSSGGTGVFNITSQKEHLARIIMRRPVVSPGGNVEGNIDFSRASSESFCKQLSVSLEQCTIIKKLKNDLESPKIVEVISCHREFVKNAIFTSFSLQLPHECCGNFQTDAMDVEWYLSFDFEVENEKSLKWRLPLEIVMVENNSGCNLNNEAFSIGLFFFGSNNKLVAFYAIRCTFAVISGMLELRFAESVARRFGKSVGHLTLFFLLSSTGMFHASTAFLPSTFAMYCVLLAYADWFDQKYFAVILSTATGVLWGWPFAGLVSFPLGCDVLYRLGFSRAFFYALIALVFLLGIAFTIDTFFYNKVMLPPAFQIIAYNVFGNSGGPDLYGVEPSNFYFRNAFLNFNIVLPLALVTPLLCLVIPSPSLLSKNREIVSDKRKNNNWIELRLERSLHGYWTLFQLSGLYIWFGFMSVVDHKEERFLFPVYPLFCLAASVTVVQLVSLIRKLIGKVSSVIYFFIGFLVLIISIARTSALIKYYSAPNHLFTFINRNLNDFELSKNGNDRVQICIGREWYRFPTHFFLPQKMELSFVDSGFNGQLPAKFSHWRDGGTWITPSHFNDGNLREKNRFVSLDSCDYLIETSESGSIIEDEKHWKVVWSSPFLNAKETSFISRILYIPWFSDKKNAFYDYMLYQRK
eukprot:g5712.t1